MKKSYGKVHRYRTAFGHTAGFWVRRVGLLAAAGLLLFLLGWVIGPAVINAGTSAWYGVKNGTASPASPVSSSGEERPAGRCCAHGRAGRHAGAYGGSARSQRQVGLCQPVQPDQRRAGRRHRPRALPLRVCSMWPSP